MSATSPASTLPVLALTTEYSTPYAALVRDEVVMGVPRYFLERWLPILGPAPAALVNTLRQLDYRCQNDVITISGEALAEEAGMSRRHLYTCLAHPWIGAFVRTLSGQRARDAEGKIWQQVNRYAVRMDDPLTPGDAEHLRQKLMTLADNPFQAAARAMALPPRALWSDQSGPAAPDSTPPFGPPAAITAREVMLRAFPDWRPSHPEEERAFNQLAEGLQRHITLGRDDGRTSKILVPQYFRRRWWTRLGHDLAWAYLWLRGNLYDRPEEGIRRDTCWVPALDTLLTLLGRPREWWRRNVEQARPHPDGWSLADFFTQIDARKGRDAEHPQWVARRFRVAIEIPIAPEDRAAYAALLRDWPASGIPPGAPPTGSASSAHTGPAEVRHTPAHRPSQGAPHFNTPEAAGSATPEHTGIEGVRHTPTQGSATPPHSEDLQPLPPASDALSATEESPSKQPAASAPSAPHPAAAAAQESGAGQGERLLDLLRRAFERAPDTPLCEAAPVRVWLVQAWAEPVRPHTPAWTLAERGALSPGDLVALILAVKADPTVQEPPRYLSWLAQRLAAEPATPPVERWADWRALAALPLSGWLEAGRERWLALVPRDRRALPFGLDDLIFEPMPEPVPARKLEAPPGTPPADGLDQRPGGGLLSVADMWRATLGQLSLQLNRATYQSRVEGAQAIRYAEGVLTVQARSAASREWLATRLAPVIERALAGMAGQPLHVQYTLKGEQPPPP